MSAAAVELQPHDEVLAIGTPALVRQQAAEVLAAHRSRRQRNAAERNLEIQSQQLPLQAELPSRSQSIASRVSERYAQSQSYRAFLAAEAEEATRKAHAVAEVAARTAQAVAEAQRRLLAELAYPETNLAVSNVSQRSAPEKVEILEQPSPSLVRPSAEILEERPAPAAKFTRADLTVKLFEDARPIVRSIPPAANSSFVRPADGSFEIGTSEETQALDEEISFRQSPSFDLERASVPIPGNLLEFPRQLVAARKARPRYAEGPLSDEGEQAHSDSQLRIFEVDPSQIASTPPIESSTPEWSSIWLDALAQDAPDEVAKAAPPSTLPRPEAASLERRIMACVVDTCLVGMGWIAFATTFACNIPVLPSLSVTLISSAGSMAALFAIYQMLFFALSNATPGMRYARIGLCTFGEENPSHIAMLNRIPATLLAAFPLGMGFLWACLDDDGLGWHDRLSGMYQRSY